VANWEVCVALEPLAGYAWRNSGKEKHRRPTRGSPFFRDQDKPAAAGRLIRLIKPGQRGLARGKEVTELHGKEPRRTRVVLLDGPLIPVCGRIHIRKN
jgi:hypothetical protein